MIDQERNGWLCSSIVILRPLKETPKPFLRYELLEAKSITELFSELREYLHSTNAGHIFGDPKRILNCDETGCLTCP
nr:unnamed protein product [Callosobruchus analis]